MFNACTGGKKCWIQTSSKDHGASKKMLLCWDLSKKKVHKSGLQLLSIFLEGSVSNVESVGITTWTPRSKRTLGVSRKNWFFTSHIRVKATSGLISHRFSKAAPIIQLRIIGTLLWRRKLQTWHLKLNTDIKRSVKIQRSNMLAAPLIRHKRSLTPTRISTPSSRRTSLRPSLQQLKYRIRYISSKGLETCFLKKIQMVLTYKQRKCCWKI